MGLLGTGCGNRLSRLSAVLLAQISCARVRPSTGYIAVLEFFSDLLLILEAVVNNEGGFVDV